MISTTYQCDFGPETQTVAGSPALPQGWLTVTLTVGSTVTTYLACPLHQSLVIVPANAPDPIIDLSGTVSKPSLQGSAAEGSD